VPRDISDVTDDIDKWAGLKSNAFENSNAVHVWICQQCDMKMYMNDYTVCLKMMSQV